MEPEQLKQRLALTHLLFQASPLLLVVAGGIAISLWNPWLGNGAKRKVLTSLPLSPLAFLILGFFGNHDFSAPTAWDALWLLCSKFVSMPEFLARAAGPTGLRLSMWLGIIWISGLTLMMWMLGRRWFPAAAPEHASVDSVRIARGPKILAGLIGAFVGGVFGAGSLWFAAWMFTGGNDLFGGFLLMWFAVPALLVGAILGIFGALRIQPHLLAVPATESERRKKSALRLGVSIGIPALLLGLFLGPRKLSEPPSDQSLIRNFRRHEKAFGQLAEMASSDKGVLSVDEDSADPRIQTSVGSPPDRIRAYRKLLREIDVPRGFRASIRGDEIDFYYWGHGSAISSDFGKGYAYRATPPSQVSESLDQFQPSGREPLMAYRNLDGNWYLFYEYLPD